MLRKLSWIQKTQPPKVIDQESAEHINSSLIWDSFSNGFGETASQPAGQPANQPASQPAGQPLSQPERNGGAQNIVFPMLL